MQWYIYKEHEFLKSMIIGITGYIGAGKTTAANFCRELGYSIIDCDSIGHEILEKDNEVQHKLIAKYGNKIIGRDLKINREILAEIIFNNQENIDELNKIIHPKLKAIVYELLDKAVQENKKVIVEAAILKELELDTKVNKIIIIKSELGIIYERLKKRYSQKQVVNIMNKQILPKKYDYLIINNESIDELKRRVFEIVKRL